MTGAVTAPLCATYRNDRAMPTSAPLALPMGEVARHSRDGEGTAATISLPQHLLTRVILSKRSASKDLGITIAAQYIENAWIPPRGCALVGMTGAVAAPLCATYRNDRAMPTSAPPCLSRWERWHGIAVTERVQQQLFPHRSIFRRMSS